MRENRVRAWVEVVGSVMKKSMKDSKGAPLCWNDDESKVAEGGKNSLPCSKNIAEFNESHFSRGLGQYDHETKLRPINVAKCNLLEIPSIRLERTTPWGNPVSAINTVRKSQAVSRWGPWKKFCPSTAYGAFSHILTVQARVPDHRRLDAKHRLGKWAPGLDTITINFDLIHW